MSRWGMRLASMGLLLALPVLLGCPSGGPGVTVYPIAFNFGDTGASDAFTVSSRGTADVTWHIENLPAWASVDLDSGTTGRGGQLATITVDRTGLAPGAYSGDFDVVGGDSTVSVALHLVVASPPPVPALSVSPAALDLGVANISGSLTVTNSGGGALAWSVTESLPWLDLSPLFGNVAEGSSGDVVTVTVDRSGLAGGTYNGILQFNSNGGTVGVPVTMQVPVDAPMLSIGSSLDFGVTSTTLSLPVTNAGTGTLDWNLNEDISWLSLSPASGQLPPATVPVTVTVDRTGLAGGEYNGVINATSNGGNATVNVRLVVAAAQLAVTPTTLQFGTYATSKLLAIGNSGSGSVNWTIDTAGFPAWLTVSPSQGAAAADTNAVIVGCNRTGLATGNYTHPFTVTSDAGNITVTANMSVATQPILTVESGFLNIDGEPLVPLGTEGATMDVTIRNTGTGTLDWSLDASDLPEWLSITPLTGTLTLTQISVVHVTVNRGDMDTGGYVYRVPLNSNAQDTFLEVTMQVPLRPDIGVDPTELRLGVDSDIGACFVANTGDANTILNYKVESDKEWLFFSPATNTSIGTASVIKDWKRVNVAVDRSMLESDGGTGNLTITAVDGAGAPLPDIPQKFIKVSVEAPSLSFEVAQARLRIPSLVRLAFIMRDARAGALFTDPAFLQSQNAFKIFEDGIELESTETNTFVVGWEKLKVNVVLMLDISGSMLDAVNQAGIGGADPLLQLYRETCAPFLDSLPPNWKVSLMEFHERHQPPNARVIHGFTLDRDALGLALQNYQVQDYGATELLPAVTGASDALIAEDGTLTPFDDADVRAVIVITDGRRTTPPGDVTDTTDPIVKDFTRVYSVGWGQDVDHEPLARLASKTGGHYYSTRPDANGHARRSELERALQLISGDMRAFRMLGYTTLNEADQAEVRVNGFFNPPEDTPDRGVIQGTFAQQIEPSKFIGDISVGQISMRSDGIDADGNARAFIHADYIPRNVNKIRFTVTASAPFTLSVAPNLENGLIENWTPQDLGGGTYRFDAAVPLPYGAFGDLVQLDFASALAPVDIQLTVDNGIYAGDLEPKSFVFANALTVQLGEPSRAPVTPAP